MHKLQTQLTQPIPFFYTKEYGYDPIKNKELPKLKYTFMKNKTHATIITEPESNYPKWHVFSLPIKHVLHVNTKLLKILFKENLITQRQVLLAYNQWVAEESEIIMTKTDHRNLLAETIKIPVRRRGNEHYHKHTWSRLQWYQMVFDSLPQIQTKTEKKKKYKGKNRAIHLFNTFIVTLTYAPDFQEHPIKALFGERRISNLAKFWEITSEDTNRYFTNLKGRLKRRVNKLQFYVKALESHKSGMPHMHILMKLKQPVECYAIPTNRGTYYRPFKKELFNWKYGFYDVKGIKKGTPGMGYICKYITKSTNPKHRNSKSLALSWMSNKRLYSNSMFDLLKWKFPSLSKKMKLTEKFTINKAVDLYWNGLKFPKVPWDLIHTKPFGFITREGMNRRAEEWLKEPLPSRLNYEGFYRVTALRCLLPQADGSKLSVSRPIVIVSRRLREYLAKVRKLRRASKDSQMLRNTKILHKNQR